MTKITINNDTTDTSNTLRDQRQAEMDKQDWHRERCRQLAALEGLRLTDAHWAVITYLRRRYVDEGLPHHARDLAKVLTDRYSPLGGIKYLRDLFPGGPVTQGSRLANLHSPSDATDRLFGHNY